MIKNKQIGITGAKETIIKILNEEYLPNEIISVIIDNKEDECNILEFKKTHIKEE